MESEDDKVEMGESGECSVKGELEGNKAQIGDSGGKEDIVLRQAKKTGVVTREIQSKRSSRTK